MEKENKSASKTGKCCDFTKSCGGGSGFVWVLGFVGAVIYYIQMATSFGEGVLGVLKAFIWPVMVVYKLLQFLG